MILDVISNDPNHKNDRFLQKNMRKTSFKIVTMVTKILTCYFSLTVPDRPIVTIIITIVISNEPNHKNDMFLQNNGRKTSLKNVTMVTKMLHVYISVTVPDRPQVTIIHR